MSSSQKLSTAGNQPRRLRPNWLDERILAGRDPWRPVYLLRFVRLQVAFIIAVAILALFTGFLWFSAQQRAHEACRLRNQRAEITTRVLDQAALAARADGDKNQQAVYSQLAKASRETPLPRC